MRRMKCHENCSYHSNSELKEGTNLPFKWWDSVNIFKNLISLSIIFFIAIFLANCTEAPKGKTKSEVIRERLHKKVDQWEKSVKNKCQRDVMEMATKIVDSTLIANARARKERESRPKKPHKPGQPEVEIPIDTTPIAPLILLEWLLNDSINIDSILGGDTLEMELLKLLEMDSLWQEEQKE